MKNKQMKIANFLKFLTVALALMGLVFFAGISYIEITNLDRAGIAAPIFTWYAALLCYLILFQFRKVAKEIGRDNSFSLENRDAFHRMGQFALAACAGFFLRLLYDLFTPYGRLFLVYIHIFLILLSLVFFGLCESLSQLIENAYEVKRENDLTI